MINVTDVRRPRLPFALGALVCAGALVSLSSGLHGQTQAPRTPAATTKPAAAGSEGTFYIGTYAGNIAIVDEATEKVMGQIPLKNGIPGDLQPSDDRTEGYVTGRFG